MAASKIGWVLANVASLKLKNGVVSHITTGWAQMSILARKYRHAPNDIRTRVPKVISGDVKHSATRNHTNVIYAGHGYIGKTLQCQLLSSSLH
ncbi:hypothetical protein J6590_028051 [Homalodisca vitripennis]|nr:hypothetical protein J6590_028051 [Homalodisca vitripennis]